ncbi:DUF4062 domain-containing protein [Flagellatimonas centrodinii]|uniref:DUF4062 domain-containing protein n=1 Tax=Flagellatimonas centrodinii TaxID=2806210 RepID=UPI001FF03220|nr:DUF4062 domain-containing protein [Flagellatimonas centrodinii]ULQ45570.1 DUF4062 domain-containing protein [Flagellatimonas centrodinii]
MPQQGQIFRALIASPSDCALERKIIPEVISVWNAVHSIDRGAIVEPVLWESHSRPEFGDRPQALINRQLVENCDLVIGAFWTRLGTPTGESESGTAEEIEQFRTNGKPVLLYFSSAPAVPESIDPDQYKALVEYRKGLVDSGLYSTYESAADFREQFQRHFAAHMIELLAKFGGGTRSGEIQAEGEVPEQVQQLSEFISQYEAFLRKLDAEWEAERDSEPHGTHDGKYILDRAADEVVHFKSMITNDSSGVSAEFGDVLKKLRGLQRHQTYMDGGVSFNEFWKSGDEVIASLKSAASKLHGLLAEAQQIVAADI